MASSPNVSTSYSPTKSFLETSPKDKVALRLLRVNGQSHTFYFTETDSASDIAKYVFNNWPQDWTEDTVNTPAVLKLIYQGRFLHGSATLGAMKIPAGKTTVMHLVSRENLPEPGSQDRQTREKTNEGGCRMCCAIL